jgi:hypothetical protein
MRATLEYASKREGSACTSGAIWGLVEATVILSGGALVAFTGETSRNATERPILTGLLLGIGASLFASSLRSFGCNSTDVRRYERWQKSPSVDGRTLARFESELVTEAEFARMSRVSSGVANIGMAVGGALLVGLTPLAKLDGDAATMSYAFGGGLALVGTLGAIFALSGESLNERVYRVYQSAEPIEQASLRWYLLPVLTPHGGGAGLVGRF